LLAGYVSERFGFRKTVVGGLVVITALLFITFFAPNLIVLEIGQVLLGEFENNVAVGDSCLTQILLGIPLGLFQTTSVIYALELSPLSLRAYLTNYVNFCWVRPKQHTSSVT
jgi:SP family general alpha glucoside:H+ symporter-like MFS transporter